jgi:hypothetical protein
MKEKPDVLPARFHRLARAGRMQLQAETRETVPTAAIVARFFRTCIKTRICPLPIRQKRSVPHPFALFANGWETTNLNRLLELDL